MSVPAGGAGPGEERHSRRAASFDESDWEDLSSHIHELQLQMNRLESRLELVEERLVNHRHYPGSGAGTEHHRPEEHGAGRN